MGLDMNVYKKNKGKDDTEIHCWRKHNALHNWMERLWNSKGNQGVFNCKNVDLTSKDLDSLEEAVKNRTLKPTKDSSLAMPIIQKKTGIFMIKMIWNL